MYIVGFIKDHRQRYCHVFWGHCVQEWVGGSEG